MACMSAPGGKNVPPLMMKVNACIATVGAILVGMKALTPASKAASTSFVSPRSETSTSGTSAYADDSELIQVLGSGSPTLSAPITSTIILNRGKSDKIVGGAMATMLVPLLSAHGLRRLTTPARRNSSASTTNTAGPPGSEWADCCVATSTAMGLIQGRCALIAHHTLLSHHYYTIYQNFITPSYLSCIVKVLFYKQEKLP